MLRGRTLLYRKCPQIDESLATGGSNKSRKLQVYSFRILILNHQESDIFVSKIAILQIYKKKVSGFFWWKILTLTLGSMYVFFVYMIDPTCGWFFLWQT